MMRAVRRPEDVLADLVNALTRLHRPVTEEGSTNRWCTQCATTWPCQTMQDVIHANSETA